MAWLILVLAGLLEVAWAIAMKQIGRSPWVSTFMIAAMIGSFVLLARAMREIPVGTAYAVWTGIGAVGVATIGIVWLGESASPKRIASLALVVVGILGLKLSSH